MSDQTDWLSYLEAEPQTEPYLSIAKAWRIDRSNLCLAEEGLANYAQENQRLEAEVQRLQRALAFWLPCVPAEGPEEVLIRTGDDAMLLVGYDPTENEPTAEERGWISLAQHPRAPQSGQE